MLDHKQLEYRVYNQMPGPHVFVNTWRTGKRTVPLLVEDGAAISGSHAICLHLEGSGTGPSLLPQTAAGRALLDEIVAVFDDQVGPAVRRYAYGFLTVRAELFNQVFFQGYAGGTRVFGQLLAPVLRREIARMYRVHRADNQQSPDLMRRAADMIEARLRDGSRYLIDDRLSLADITVASLLAPMTGPRGSPWTFEPEVPELQALRAELRDRPVGAYIAELYASR